MRAGQGSRETYRQERLLQQHSLVISSDRTAAPYGRHIQLGSRLCLLLMALQPLQLQAQPSGSLLALNCSKAAYRLHLLPGLGIAEQLQVTTGRQIALLMISTAKCR